MSKKALLTEREKANLLRNFASFRDWLAYGIEDFSVLGSKKEKAIEALFANRKVKK